MDAYLASEEVIQHLTDKNLDMEEKIRSVSFVLLLFFIILLVTMILRLGKSVNYT